ncbi:MAG: DNA adenine methylase [Planctomycetaceae bacterium]|jgi:DNA adenine methylase|nr:DNA adenine methylase [Planctomycetaceae bacterium]
MTTNLTQPLKWHGGKYYLRNWIIGLMPPHLHYVEPFFGGGSVFLARDPNRDWWAASEDRLAGAEQGCSEVVNDVHGELTNFWRVLQSTETFEAFRRRVEVTPFSEFEFNEAAAATNARLFATPSTAATNELSVERAVQFFILARQSRQGVMRDFATLSRNRTRSRVSEQASAWLSVVEGLPDVHRRLRGVVILNQNACDVIRKQDGPKTLFYCDPPYLHETRSTTGEYHFEMSEEQHRELLQVLTQIEGKFMLSGYPSPLYDQWQKNCGWKRHDCKIDNKAAAGKVKETKIECLWCNF